MEADPLLHAAHMLWQSHGLKIEDFMNMPQDLQCSYIASEQIEADDGWPHKKVGLI